MHDARAAFSHLALVEDGDPHPLSHCACCIGGSIDLSMEHTRTRSCACGRALHRTNQSGTCQPCLSAARRAAREKGQCKVCAKPLWHTTTTGYCRQHYAAVNNVGRPPSGNRRDRRLDWCPPEYRASYRTIVRRRIPATDARRMILDLIATDLRRYQATGQLQQSRRAG